MGIAPSVNLASTRWIADDNSEWILSDLEHDTDDNNAKNNSNDSSEKEDEQQYYLDVGRLTAAERAAITASRDGQPASSIFAVLGLWQLCQKKYRIAPRAASGGYTLWAVDDARTGACAIDRSKGISLCNAFKIVRNCGVATLSTYRDQGGISSPSLAAVIEADLSPFFEFYHIDQKPEVLISTLESGKGFVFAWGFQGFISRLAIVCDDCKARVAKEPQESKLDDSVEWTTALIVGYDPVKKLFYGHAPVGVSGADDLLVAFTPSHISNWQYATSFWTGELVKEDAAPPSFIPRSNLSENGRDEDTDDNTTIETIDSATNRTTSTSSSSSSTRGTGAGMDDLE